MEEETKKSYNPFKMWGSWVGIILFLIIPILSISNVDVTTPACHDGSLIENVNCWHDGQIEDNIRDGRPANKVGTIMGMYYITFAYGLNLDTAGMGEIGTNLLFLIFNIVVGFLFGWGIHSLIRKIKSKKVG